WPWRALRWDSGRWQRHASVCRDCGGRPPCCSGASLTSGRRCSRS
ncbi:MAG: hypothetical protein AVDCRST_MAG42-2139, partial [uncultured Chthoniobacterales bacterium]